MGRKKKCKKCKERFDGDGDLCFSCSYPYKDRLYFDKKEFDRASERFMDQQAKDAKDMMRKEMHLPPSDFS